MAATVVSVLFLCVLLFAVVRSDEPQVVEEDEDLHLPSHPHRLSVEVGLPILFGCLGEKNGHGDIKKCIKKFVDECKPDPYMIECAKAEMGRGCSGNFAKCLDAFHKCIEDNEPGSGTESHQPVL